MVEHVGWSQSATEEALALTRDITDPDQILEGWVGIIDRHADEMLSRVEIAI